MSDPRGSVAEVEYEHFDDYFTFNETRKFFLPDGKQWIEYKVFNEGDKAKFQKKTGRDVRVNTRTNDATLKSDIAADRHALIETAVVNWRLLERGPDGRPTERPFGGAGMRDFLTLANPRIVEDLEREIRKANPWLMGDMKVEDIDREIENLQEMRRVAEERENSGNS